MKILVTGQNSYAGTQFAKRMTELNKGWKIDFISVRDNAWQEKTFTDYDAVYHVAGIVHKKEDSKNKELYYQVNRDLTYNLALKAKKDRVKSFVFLSTMAVYGVIGKIGEDTIISKTTKAAPTSYYAKSKLEAEKLIETLQSERFNVCILRVPMIYGPECPGNYKMLSKLARVTPIFPKINNKRSMIFVDNLSEVVAFIIEEELAGLKLVKNPQDVNTTQMVNEIALNHNKKIHNSNFAGLLIKKIGIRYNMIQKIFSSVYYADSDCEILLLKNKYVNFKESINLSEKKL